MSLVDRLSPPSGPGWQPFWDRRKSQTTFGERTFAKFRNKNAVFVNFCNKNVIFFNYPIPDDSENILGIARNYQVLGMVSYGIAWLCLILCGVACIGVNHHF